MPTELPSILIVAAAIGEPGRSARSRVAEFRAAAVEQLTIWCQRIGVEIVGGKVTAQGREVLVRIVDEE